MRRRRWIAGVLLAGAAASAVAVLAVPELNWRARVVAMKVSGEIPDVGGVQLLRMIAPGSGYYLERLAETGNPYSVISNPHDSPEDAVAGEALYRTHCAACHGAEAEGETGPPLNTGVLERGNTDWWIYRVVTQGIPDSPMVGRDLPEKDVWQMIAYLRKVETENTRGDETSGPAPAAPSPVTSARLHDARAEPHNWLTYSGAYDGKRHSRLDQINRKNADALQLKWILQTDGDDGYVETSPIVNDGVMFVTEAPRRVRALDAASGDILWTYERAVASDVSLCCGQVNRGVAVAGERVFWGTVDANLVALDAGTGDEIWTATVDDYRNGTSITSAPLVVDDLVVIGVGGGEYGIRGFLDAYDIGTGERVWRFYTIPGEGEPGNDTWAGDSWKTGGAPTWLSGSYDPDLGLLYWGTGNPGPLHQGDYREGDNLYANSVVALDAATGELQWHFQFTPHDVHDWDSNQTPVLVDRDWNGAPRPLMLWANRNGFFYVLDRQSGEFLSATAYAEQNWAERIDPDGRPVRREEALPTPQGAVVFPSPHGASNWQSPTYSPRTDLMYVPAIDGGRIVFKQEDEVEYIRGAPFHGSMHQLISEDRPFLTTVRAIDPSTGEVEWEHRNPRRNIFWKTGGLLSTAGDIVFGGDLRDLFVLDATTGEELWRLNVGGYVNAVPVTYAVDGRQYLTMAAGRSILTFGLPDDDFATAEPEHPAEP